MRKPIANWLLFSLCLLLFQTDSARGAEVVALAPCDISISGVLEAGDSAAYRRLVDAGRCSFTTLHLDSPGGSLTEVFEIADQFFRTRTVIDDNAQCLSACALLFMAGRACSGSPFTCTPLRDMHMTSVLGFHAPFLEATGGEQLVARDVSYSQAVGVFAEILENLARYSAQVRQTGYDKDIIPSDLLARMFVTPPQDFYLVESNDQLFSWDIGLHDNDAQSGEPSLTEAQVGTLCYALIFHEMRGWSYIDGEFGGYGAFVTDSNRATTGFVVKPLDGFSVPGDANSNSQEYLMSFENLNMGPAVSGW